MAYILVALSTILLVGTIVATTVVVTLLNVAKERGR
jgi:hypothetical protein